MSDDRQRAAQQSAGLRTALGSDQSVYAKFCDIWRNPRAVTAAGDSGPRRAPETPVSLNDAAWELGMGVAKVAVTMKYGVKQGYFRVTTPRGDQAAWEPTPLGIETFLNSNVMPERVEAGGFASMTQDEARDDEGWIPLDPSKPVLDQIRQPPALPEGDSKS